MAQQTLRDVAKELELFEFSQQYLDLLKEEAEIVLCDQYLAMQESLKDMTYRSYMTEGYLLEEVTEEAKQQVAENNEKRKSTFRGKVLNILIKAYRFVVKFFRGISEAWHSLLPSHKQAIASIEEKLNQKPITEEQAERLVNQTFPTISRDNGDVKPFKTQPAAKMIAKRLHFDSNVSQEMKDAVIRYFAFAVGDIIVIQSTGREIQMDNVVRLARMKGLANDSVDDQAGAQVIATLKKQAQEEGIRVRIDGDYFKKISAYYEKMAKAYENRGTKYTTNQTEDEIAADLKNNDKAKERAQKKQDQITGRSKACAEIAGALSASCTLINHAFGFQKRVLNWALGKNAEEKKKEPPVQDDVVSVTLGPDGTPVQQQAEPAPDNEQDDGGGN